MKIGILGAGNIAEMMAKTLLGMEDAKAYAVAARELSRAEAFAQKFGFEKAYGSYKALVSDPEVGLVYIATPHNYHFEHAKLCLEHKKPVLCEKPFTVNAAQAKELFRIADENEVFITEAIWTRYMPMRFKLDEIIKSGVIGEITSITANLGYELDQKERMVRPELAGGALLDVGVYPIHFAGMVFGDQVKKVTSTCIFTETGVDAQNTMIFEYEDKKTAILHSNMQAVTDRQGVINGRKGFIVVDNINNCEGIHVFDETYRETAFYKTPEQITGFEYEVRASIKSIKGGKIECEEMTHKMTVQVMELLDAIRKDWNLIYPFE